MSKIPDNARLVYDGLIYQVYQWDQTMFDGTTSLFEEIKRAASVFVLPIVNNKILVAYQQQPQKKGYYWSLIGGRAEKDELPLDAAKRELLEETGLAGNERNIRFEKQTPIIDRNFHYYIIKDAVKIQEPENSNGEKIEIKELEFNEFIEMVLRGDIQNYPLMHMIYELMRENKLDDVKALFFGS